MGKIDGFLNYFNMIFSNTNIKNRVIIAIKSFDMFYWINKKHLMQQEYFQYEFAYKKKKEKNQYVRDWEVLNVVGPRFNSKTVYELLDDKYRFNEMFRDLIGREYCYIGENDYALFYDFSKKHKRVMLKPNNMNGGNGITKFDTESIEPKALFDVVCSMNTKILLEEVLDQNEKMESICPDTVNTIRIISMCDSDGTVHMPMASIRVGRKGKCVDNFCAGGMVASIDVDSGVVSSAAYDKFCERYSNHPDTGVKFEGFEIPNWKIVLNTVKEAANRIPDARYVGWDIAIKRDNSIAIIEANARPEARLHQLPIGKGLRSVYVKYLGKF